MRVNVDLADDIERIARRNHLKLTEASREASKIIRRQRNKRLIREIQF